MATTKEDVLNSLSMFNTVGQELMNIFLAHGISHREAEEAMGCIDLPSKEKLTKVQIIKACKILKIDKELEKYLISFQENYKKEKKACNEKYQNSKKNFNRLKPILALLRGEFTQGIDVLEDILDYFDVDCEDDIFQASERSAVLFRQQNNVEVDAINLKAWLRRGELDFQKLIVPEFNEKGLLEWIDAKEWKSQLRSVEYFKQLPSKMITFGVALIYVPFLPKTVYGAVRWFDGKPLIQISDRNQDLATCWFTLFHELGHIIHHKNQDVLEGELNEPKTKKCQKEREANKFANDYLFNGDGLRKKVFDIKRNRQHITAAELSRTFNVDELFTAYWLKRAQCQPSMQMKIHIDFNN